MHSREVGVRGLATIPGSSRVPLSARPSRTARVLGRDVETPRETVGPRESPSSIEGRLRRKNGASVPNSWQPYSSVEARSACFDLAKVDGLTFGGRFREGRWRPLSKATFPLITQPRPLVLHMCSYAPRRLPLGQRWVLPNLKFRPEPGPSSYRADVSSSTISSSKGSLGSPRSIWAS
jgi:hypothetical protein